MNLKKFLINLLMIAFAFSSIAEEKVLKDQNTEFSVYTGMFDFSDDGKKSTLIGFQHQNENLNRDTFLGNLSPITGFLFTADNAGYFYTGMFDFSDDGKKSTLIGFQHQNENLNRDTFLGNLSPITGFLITADNAGYIYTGVQAQYKLGALNLTPSFTPGIYHEGDGKDLGHLIEFKSELQISLDLSKTSELGFSYNHISNASLGDKNPGANSYMFNFFKSF